MKNKFVFAMFIDITIGANADLVLRNIVAGVSCGCAIGNLPVLFIKQKTRIR